MIIDKFSELDLDNLMDFLDDNITENYEKGVFLTIMKRWPEGFLVVRSNNKIPSLYSLSSDLYSGYFSSNLLSS